MGAAALQKYIGSLGGIGTSGVGSSATYAPKDLNKEIMPEKVITVLNIHLAWVTVICNANLLLFNHYAYFRLKGWST